MNERKGRESGCPSVFKFRKGEGRGRQGSPVAGELQQVARKGGISSRGTGVYSLR